MLWVKNHFIYGSYNILYFPIHLSLFIEKSLYYLVPQFILLPIHSLSPFILFQTLISLLHYAPHAACILSLPMPNIYMDTNNYCKVPITIARFQHLYFTCQSIREVPIFHPRLYHLFSVAIYNYVFNIYFFNFSDIRKELYLLVISFLSNVTKYGCCTHCNIPYQKLLLSSLLLT